MLKYRNLNSYVLQELKTLMAHLDGSTLHVFYVTKKFGPKMEHFGVQNVIWNENTLYQGE
jgi:hypothetical protein